MNLLLFAREDLCDGGMLAVTGERAHHLVSTLKVKPGTTLRVGEVNGPLGRAEVIEVGKSEVRLRLLGCEDSTVNALAVELFLALPRPQTLKKVLEFAGAVGIRRIYLIDAERVEKSYFSSSVLQPENIFKHLRLGMEQGVNTRLPEVIVLSRTKAVYEMIAEKAAEVRDGQQVLRLLAHPDEQSKPLTDGQFVGLSGDCRVIAAIGPEGGFRDEEAAMFVERGFMPCRLGRFTLRVEHAVCYLMAQLELLRVRR